MSKFVILLIAGTMLLAGCAVGHGTTGEIILGVEVGVLAETTEQVLGAAVNTFLPGIGTLLTSGLMSVGGVGAITATVRANRKRKNADQARERAEKDMLIYKTREDVIRGIAVVEEPEPTP